ncbi:nitrilase-related carbon-nitrogen hydrolase [Spirosoma panaciterrae]|uniref:nitrilase-related carbon-nitrogen hydrolase n=1 Tax=Spirosoma panaciterrae TaxID=496058 RepID=UPI000363018E|nr:nitrilase-related carbon-nitrogen hydrolase [Spirosoma panaciterrae]
MQTYRNLGWLALSLACLIISRQWLLPIFALLSPLFLLHFLRTQSPGRGLLLVGVGLVASILWVYRGLAGPMFHSPASFVITLSVSTLIGLIPFWLHRLLSHTFPLLTASLIFPATKTILEYVGSLNSPFGVWGSQAALFADWLPLAQVVSVTGIWGLSFFLSWSISLAALVWSRPKQNVQSALIPYALVLVVIVGYGSSRLLQSGESKSAKVASILTNDTYFKPLKSSVYQDLANPSVLTSSVAQANTRWLLTQTEQAAKAGAKLIFWAEGNGIILPAQEPELIRAAAQLATRYQAYLGLAVEVIHSGASFPVENKIVLLQPNGQVAFTYLKHYPIGIEQELMRKGDGKIPVAQTPFGKLAAMICFDTDFIAYARKAGQLGVQLLVAPSNDWAEIADMRGLLTQFRALENGLTLIRSTSHGVTEVVDPYGRVKLRNNYFEHPQTILYANAPLNGQPTLYARFGDWFPWCCVVLMLCIGFSRIPRRIHQVGLLILMLIVTTAQAQQRTEPTAKTGFHKTIVLPALSYTPETSVALGVTGVHLSKPDSLANLSQVSATALYTFKNQFLVEGKTQLYRGKYLLMGNVNYSRYPEYFFGIGNETQADNKTIITYSAVRLNANLARQLAPHLYGGLAVNYSHYFHINQPERYLPEPFGQQGGVTTGLGWAITFDSRDHLLNAYRGWYATLSAIWNTQALGGHFDYISIDADVRKFVPVNSGGTLAFQALVTTKSGEVPFLQLAYLGGSSMMRGFYAGRYRDNNLMAIQSEYRRRLSAKWGFVLFAGTGKVFNSWNQADLSGLKTSLGLGFRRTISRKDRVNLRIDGGLGDGYPNFYVSITEAF